MSTTARKASLPLLAAGSLLPLAVALLLLVLVVRPASRGPFEVRLKPVDATAALELEALFSDQGYTWPPSGEVPPLWVGRLPADLTELRVPQKKALFFRALLPLVLAENTRIRRQRTFIQHAYGDGFLRPGSTEHGLLLRLLDEYGVEALPASPAAREALLRRVDEVPPGLVLAQAANESAWGTSRFVREGNNLFGEWTWRAEAGIVPLERAAGQRHFVRVFPDLRQSVRSYLNNLNTGRAYHDLRRLRATLRTAGQPLDPILLAGTLSRYSQRGDDYIAEIRAMIRHNELNRLGSLRLAAPAKGG